VLREIGLNPQQIAALKDRGIVAGRRRMTRIHFNEVVTRDGFQMEPEFVPTDAKVALVDALSDLRLRQDRGDLVHLAQGDPDAARRRGGDGPHPPRARRGVHRAGAQPARAPSARWRRGPMN
jgi:isopropylmalate/homocitrate/citramalate synthase